MDRIRNFLIWLLLNAGILVLGVPTPSENYMRSVILSSPDNYIIYWNYNDTSVTFEVHVKTSGYVGFGLSPNGGMPSSDIMVGGIKDGSPYIEDRYATSNSIPEIDTQQDWNLISGSYDSGYTILKFSRLLKTCDSRDREISFSTIRIIWSYSASSSLVYHGSTNRGTKSLHLLSPEVGAGQALPNDATFYEFLIDNVTIPETDTYYYCRNFQVPPNITTKHHIIKVDPVIQTGNEKVVHHILLQACHTSINDSWHGTQYHCREWETSPTARCVTLIAAWAIGGPSFWFPDDVGLPIGDGHITFIVMQMHYDNPALRTDLYDNSGMRMWITPTLRRFDAGILETGAIPSSSQIIPPGQNNFITHGWCTNSCWDQVSSTHPEGFTIFAVVHHTHLLGVAIRFRHFRNGIELPPIAVDEHYDFDFQVFKPINPTVKVLPSDDLLVECVYKSTGRSNVTFGGEGTRQEMCLVFAAYYPRMPFSLCISSPTTNAIRGSLTNAASNPTKSVEELVYATDWTQQQNVDFFQRRINEGGFFYHCQNNYGLKQTPAIVSAYTTADSCNMAPRHKAYSVTTLLCLLLYLFSSNM